MKLQTTILLVAASASTQAAVVTTQAGSKSGALPNFWNASLAAGDSTSFAGDFSSWAWHDTNLGSNVGWRHTADWFELTLTTDALVTFDLNRVTGGPNAANAASLFPSFTLYRGISDISDLNDSNEELAGTDEFGNPTRSGFDDRHIFNNIADTQIHPEAITLEYLAHLDNTTGASASQTFALAAGEYTFTMGGNTVAEANLTALPTDYRASVTATPIPEPSSLFLLALGCNTLVRRRR